MIINHFSFPFNVFQCFIVRERLSYIELSFQILIILNIHLFLIHFIYSNMIFIFFYILDMNIVRYIVEV